MPSYKVLKSVAHNLGHSFLSDMNTATSRESSWFVVPQHLFEIAQDSEVAKLEIDFMSATIFPEVFRTREVLQSITRYRASLPELVEAQGGAWDRVRSVTLELEFDLSQTRRAKYHPHRPIPTFTCRVEILDDRGVVHIGTPTNWWIAWGPPVEVVPTSSAGSACSSVER